MTARQPATELALFSGGAMRRFLTEALPLFDKAAGRFRLTRALALFADRSGVLDRIDENEFVALVAGALALVKGTCVSLPGLRCPVTRRPEGRSMTWTTTFPCSTWTVAGKPTRMGIDGNSSRP